MTDKFSFGSNLFAYDARTPIAVYGMHGIGDSLHQRALVTQLVEHYNHVQLETPWPQLYWDFPEHLRFFLDELPPHRLQLRNARYFKDEGIFRERWPFAKRVRIRMGMPRPGQTVLQSMIRECNGSPNVTDFRLPIKPEWREIALQFLRIWGLDRGPLMILRQLTRRAEWRNSEARNPDPAAFRVIYESLRRHYNVLSLGTVQPPDEVFEGSRLIADVHMDFGQVQLEVVAALFAEADLVFTPPGFGIVMAQAVGTKVISVFGGFECSDSFMSGAQFSPSVFIDPIRPCPCFQPDCPGDKTVDLGAAFKKIESSLWG